MALGMVRWITLITMMCLCCCGCSDFQTALRDDDVDVSDLDYEGDENLSDVQPSATSRSHDHW
jgi:hypothetical protein